MSGAEQVDSFNPLLIVIWLSQLILLGWDWSNDGKVSSITVMIIGSFFIIQVYMVWKTNYDKMEEERRDTQAKALGGPIDTPMIDPSNTNLKDLYKNDGDSKSTSKRGMININTDPSDVEKE